MDSGGYFDANCNFDSTDSDNMKNYRASTDKTKLKCQIQKPQGWLVNNGVKKVMGATLNATINIVKAKDVLELKFTTRPGEFLVEQIKLYGFCVPDMPCPRQVEVSLTDFTMVHDGYISCDLEQTELDPARVGPTLQPELPIEPLQGPWSDRPYVVHPSNLTSPVRGWLQPYIRSALVLTITVIGIAVKDQYTMYVRSNFGDIRSGILFYRMYWRRTAIAVASAGALAYFAPLITDHIGPSFIQGKFPPRELDDDEGSAHESSSEDESFDWQVC